MTLLPSFASVLHRFSTRMRRARPGSILILVIALLLMIAMLGAASISSARTDRYASRQHMNSTQIDLLMDGVVNMVQAKIVDDLFDSDGSFRPNNGTTYDNWDCPTLDASQPKNDAWLAERLPVPYNPSLPVSSTNAPVWPWISAPLIGSLFESPNTGAQYPRTANVAPIPLVSGTTKYPGLSYYNGSAWTNVLAADADGDGIADSGLVKLPVGQINGVTYYAAARIIDNNSAINANTARSKNSDYNSAGARTDTLGTTLASASTNASNLGMFRSHVGLLQLLNKYDATTDSDNSGATAEWATLNNYRFNGSVNASLTPVDDAGVGTNRTDFGFMTQGDASEMQLARRLDNPGYRTQGSGTTAGTKYLAFTLSDMLPLAARFCVRPTSGSTSTLELALALSLSQTLNGAAINTTAWTPGSEVGWFNSNFDFTATANSVSTTRSLRPIVVTRNPVSNLIGVPNLASAVTWTSVTAFPLGQVAYFNGTYYLCVGVDDNQANTNHQPSTAGDQWWAQLSSSTTPARFSANTASIYNLWAGFVAMMGKSSTGPIIDKTPFGTATNQRMFRSPIRSSNNTFSSTQVMYLRAAMAAANAKAMADGSDDVNVVKLNISPAGVSSSQHGLHFNIYGIKKQPYITEVYVNTDTQKKSKGSANPHGYFAVELYNPYSVDISLKNWAILTKTGVSVPNASGFYLFGTVTYPTVPAGGYLVLENLGTGTDDANYRPSSANDQPPAAKKTVYFQVPRLDLVAGSEVILMRPRRFDGTLTASSDRDLDETTSTLTMVPTDQFDFTGLPVPSGNDAYLLHYCRANGAGNEWKFVYPGAYDKTLSAARLSGTQQTWFKAGTSEPSLNTSAKLGGADASASYSPTFTIQLANGNGGGLNPVTSATGNKYPFGGFARNGDLQQAPFIGSYVCGAWQDNGNQKMKDGDFIECNTLTIDSSFADDADSTDDSYEKLGRFCPLRQFKGFSGTDYYSWANLVDYFTTVLNPANDFLPNINIATYSWMPTTPWAVSKTYAVNDQVVDGNVAYICKLAHTSPATGTLMSDALAATRWNIVSGSPQSTKNSGYAARANEGLEDTEPVQGLININTAPWPVLDSIPWVSNTTWNKWIAKSITYYRNDPTKGPFTSIFELNKVSIVDDSGNYQCDLKDAWWKCQGLSSAPTPGVSDGNFAAGGSATTDLLQQNLIVTRVSNLITTRSDSFTCYMLLQGWQGVGTSKAQMVVQRRRAFIVDRSRITPTNKTPSVTSIPTE